MQNLQLQESAVFRAAVFLALVLTGSIVIACSGATPEASPLPSGPTPTVTAPVDLPMTVSLAGRFSGPALALLDQQIADFEAGNPDIRVEVVRAPRDVDRRREWIATRLAEGDDSIDLFLLDATWPAGLAAAGGLVPLDQHLAAQGVDASDFLPATIQGNTFSGQLVALPWSADGGLLYYRRDLLDKYGYEPPTNWADLQRIALDVRAREGLPYGFVWQGTAGENLTCATLEFVWSHGGDVLDDAGQVIFDSPHTHSALQQMTDLILSGASPQDVATYDDLRALTAFRSGEAVFLRNWFVAWDHLNGDDSPVAGQIGVAPLPASCLGGQSLGLSAHSLHPDKALRLMAFLIGYDQQVQMAVSAGQPPALEAAYRDSELLANASIWEVLLRVFSGARARPSVAQYAQLSEAIYTEVNRMLAGDQDVGATVATIQRRIESALQ